jgi:SNF2 family DNA or RNA helicase
MLIHVSKSNLIISESSSKLKSDQVNQLKYWGFVRGPKDDVYTVNAQNFGSLLLKLLRYFDTEGISYCLSQSCQKYLLELNQRIKNFEEIKLLGKEYKEGRFDKVEFNEFSRFINDNVSRKLKEHQLKAAFHLYLVRNGANFSVPGSGKTTAILSVYEKLKCEGKVNLLFVVGPPACFGPWRTEFEETFGRPPDWRVLAGGDQAARKSEYFTPAYQKAELYLTTFQTLLNDQSEAIRFLGQQGIEAFLVIDEAHYVKQIEGNWANAVLGISEHAKYRCILTGTPIPRSYTDVFNLFDFLWPSGEAIDSDTKISVQVHEERNDPESAKEVLKESIGSLFYRVRKSELGLIPPEFHAPYVLPMNRYEKIIYEAIQNKIRNYSKQDYLKNIDLVRKLRRGRIIRLRQCVSYAKLLSTVVEDYREKLVDDESDLGRIIFDYDDLEVPAKLEYLKQFVGNLQETRQKVVIWAYFIDTLKLIRNHLTDAGFYCKLIYGHTPVVQTAVSEEETRERIRDEFVDAESGLDILVANPAACAESISLHKTCYHAIYYDLSYNCAQYLQSLDRIHRVGGSEINQAHYHFLQYENTIDQDIKANLEQKAEKMYDVIEEDYSIYSLDMFEENYEVQAYERVFGETQC